MKNFLILTLLFFLINEKCIPQSINWDENSVGFIVLDDSLYCGTGFVLSNPNTVITCAHVVDSTKKISFVVFNTEKPFTLELIKYDINNDIAVLKSQTDICQAPLLPDTAFKIYPSQHLFYLGYNISKSSSHNKTLQADKTFVSAVGKTQSGNKIVDFIEFIGVGIPGYSGCPIFNDNGKVIALMHEAWFKQGVKGGQVQLINRAFSIKPIFEK